MAEAEQPTTPALLAAAVLVVAVAVLAALVEVCQIRLATMRAEAAAQADTLAQEGQEALVMAPPTRVLMAVLPPVPLVLEVVVAAAAMAAAIAAAELVFMGKVQAALKVTLVAPEALLVKPVPVVTQLIPLKLLPPNFTGAAIRAAHLLVLATEPFELFGLPRVLPDHSHQQIRETFNA